MSNQFDRALRHILKVECPPDKDCRTDDPADPGGRTAYGITQRTYDKWLVKVGLSKADVWNITMDEVRAIYLDKYWTSTHAAEMPDDVALVFFDIAVNSGPKSAGLVLQRALRVFAADIVVDGIVGTKTLQAVEERRGLDTRIANEMLWQRLEQYRLILENMNRRGDIDAAAKWGPVWLWRVIQLRKEINA